MSTTTERPSSPSAIRRFTLTTLAMTATVLLAHPPAVAGLLGERTTTEVPFPDAAPVHLRYPARGPDNVRFEATAILAVLRDAMARQSRMPTEQVRDQATTRISRLERSLVPNKAVMTFKYVHKRVLEGSNFVGQELTIAIPYTVSETDDSIDIDLTPPPTASLLTSTQLLQVTLKVEVDQALREMASLLINAPSMRLTMLVPVKGEAQSKFQPSAVMASFQRILGKTSMPISATDSLDPFSLRGIYAFGLGSERVPFKVVAAPYRDGTKVVYEANLPCYLHSGQAAENTDAAEKLRGTVEKVLAD